jgi:hypothetical protein
MAIAVIKAMRNSCDFLDLKVKANNLFTNAKKSSNWKACDTPTKTVTDYEIINEKTRD